MTWADIHVLIVYFAGLLAVAFVCLRRNKNVSELFAADRQCPWWLSGMSGFMTVFSSATFVVWGGVAFRLGAVAILILMTFGLGSLLVGFFVAARWHKLGVSSAVDFLGLRFGPSVVHLYTWLTVVLKLICLGIALYGLARILSSLVPLEAGHPLADPRSHTLAVHWAILFCGLVVVFYTTLGGLWAVLITDTIQFVVLCVCVLFVVPLMFAKIGGVHEAFTRLPSDFFLPVREEFGWIFLASWVILNFTRLGAEWAYVQRFVCVPTARDARKAAYTLGILYLVSPVFWLMPAILYRLIDPAADPEQAYILACQDVLPAGMLGMMIAAMFSATASSASAELNVSAGVLTRDIYGRLFHPHASEPHLVWVGRIVSLLLGVLFIGTALIIPKIGTAEHVVLVVSSLLAGPMAVPVLWGLFSRRTRSVDVWVAVFAGFAAGLVLKALLDPDYGLLAQSASLEPVIAFLDGRMRTMEALVGIFVPLMVLAVLDLRNHVPAAGWLRVRAYARQSEIATAQAGSCAPPALPMQAVGASALGVGAIIAGLALVNDSSRLMLALVGGVMAVVGAQTLYMVNRTQQGVPAVKGEAV